MKAPILEGKQVILKPLAISQASIFLRWIKNPEINIFLIMDGEGLNLGKEKEYIKNSLIDKSKLNWAIYTNQGTLVGTTGINGIDKKNKKCSWGIFIGDKNYWGQGLGTDTLRIILNYAFKNLKLNRVELGVFPHNPRGKRCYEKCGFKIEGVKRQAIRKNGEFIDEIIMGITKNDYNKLNKKYARRKK